jgi:hypothetical protein
MPSVKPGDYARQLAGRAGVPPGTGAADGYSASAATPSFGGRQPLPLPQGDIEQARARLAEAIEARNAERQYYDELTAGGERAAGEWREARRRLDAAEEAVDRARHGYVARTVQAYLDGRPTGDGLAAAEEEVAQDTNALDNIRRVEDGITKELRASELRLRDRERVIRERKGEVVVASEAFAKLFDDLAQAWQAVRSARTVLQVIFRQLHGVPHSALIRAEGSEPIDAGYVGFPTPSEDVERWKTALDALSASADAELPAVKR